MLFLDAGSRNAVAAEVAERQGRRDARQHDENLLADHRLPPSWY